MRRLDPPQEHRAVQPLCRVREGRQRRFRRPVGVQQSVVVLALHRVDAVLVVPQSIGELEPVGAGRALGFGEHQGQQDGVGGGAFIVVPPGIRPGAGVALGEPQFFGVATAFEASVEVGPRGADLAEEVPAPAVVVGDVVAASGVFGDAVEGVPPAVVVDDVEEGRVPSGQCHGDELRRGAAAVEFGAEGDQPVAGVLPGAAPDVGAVDVPLVEQLVVGHVGILATVDVVGGPFGEGLAAAVEAFIAELPR